MSNALPLPLPTPTPDASFDAMDDAMRRALGLAPRPTEDSPEPVMPVGLVARTLPSGAVRLRWKRNGGPRSTVFVAETSVDGVDWRYLRTTTRSSVLAYGFPSQGGTWFRVTAMDPTITRPASAPITAVSLGSHRPLPGARA